MAKNASNELKFGPDMYFYEIYQILEDFQCCEIVPFFFDGKCIRAFENAQNWLKIGTLIINNALNRI